MERNHGHCSPEGTVHVPGCVGRHLSETLGTLCPIQSSAALRRRHACWLRVTDGETDYRGVISVAQERNRSSEGYSVTQVLPGEAPARVRGGSVWSPARLKGDTAFSRLVFPGGCASTQTPGRLGQSQRPVRAPQLARAHLGVSLWAPTPCSRCLFGVPSPPPCTPHLALL